jgi:ketosteroid isomerase-like protein
LAAPVAADVAVPTRDAALSRAAARIRSRAETASATKASPRSASCSSVARAWSSCCLADGMGRGYDGVGRRAAGPCASIAAVSPPESGDPGVDDPDADPDAAAVLAANAAFYAAFEARSLDAMAEVWERTSRVTVVHPGWAALHGWAKVATSWDAIFRGPAPHVFVSDEEVRVHGDVAWVACYEHLLDSVGALEGGPIDDVTIATTNVFARAGDGWRLVLHHGSPVARGAPGA